MQSSDLSVLYFFNQTIASPTLDGVMGALTNVHYWYAIYVLGGLYLIYRYKWQGVRMVIGALLVVAITDSLGHYLLKPLIGRARPCSLLPGGGHLVSWIRLPIGMKWDESFPSNHALNNFAVASFFGVISQRKRGILWLYVAALVISVGRIYEGVHYPSDVVGGAVIGITAGVLLAILFHWVEERVTGTAPKEEPKVELSLEEIGSVDLAEKKEIKRVWVR